MKNNLPAWVDPAPWMERCRHAGSCDVRNALTATQPAEFELAALLSPAARPMIEDLARRSRDLTTSHFGNIIDLYIPLYLSDECTGGCAYCGFAADRHTPRRTLTLDEVDRELDAVAAMGLQEILLLTGERSPHVDATYVGACITRAAQRFHRVTIETFPMTVDEYRHIAACGCSGVTIYQETYDPERYAELHRWGPKRDFPSRLDAPARVLAAGIRTCGLGALLGLHDSNHDMLALYRHARHLQRDFWRGGLSISFPRVCPEGGGFIPPSPVDETRLTQIVCAFRIALPDMPLILSTRERPAIRDGLAGIGITRMSVASRTTVGGYAGADTNRDGQFHVHDDRPVEDFCAALRKKGLEPVFKNWETIYR